MSWSENVTKACTNKGGKVNVLYNQALDNRTKSGGSATEHGWCLAMSIYWLQKGLKDEDFWGWFQPPFQASPSAPKGQNGAVGPVFNALKEIMVKDTAEMAKMAQAKDDKAILAVLNWWIKDYCAKLGFKRNEKGDGHALKVDSDGLSDLITKTPATKLISCFGSKGAHAMAARIGAKWAVFMDPNYGEFYFPDHKKLNDFLKTFWKATKYLDKMSDAVTVTSVVDTGAGMV
jgi:hypothetical protein